MPTPKKDPKDYKKMGRPTKYTPELADLICERIAINPVGLKHIIDLYEDMPAQTTIYEWHARFPDFREKYLAAKAIQSIIKVQEIDDILSHPIIYITDEKGNKRIDPPSASMAIARCNNRKWEAARLAPKIYADNSEKIDQEKNKEFHKEAMERKRVLEEENKKEY